MLVVAMAPGLSLTAVLTALSVLRSPLLRNAAAVFIAGLAYIKTFAPYAGGGGRAPGRRFSSLPCGPGCLLWFPRPRASPVQEVKD
jgi:hypothetical protein